VIIGTSDLPADGADEAVCSEAEIGYFIGLTSRVFPGIKVSRAEIVFTFSGVRPLTRSTARLTGQISRDHSLREDSLGDLPVLSMVGGKWTTFRAFSEKATDRVFAVLGKTRTASTAELPIGGGRDWPSTPAGQEELALRLVHERGIAFNRARILLERYGTRAFKIFERISRGVAETMLVTLPGYSREEIAFLVAEEKVERLDDLLLRRSTVAWLGRATRPVLEEMADIAGRTLGWDAEKREAEIERTAKILRERHRAKA
jgi:glycerol-3-phosphate dehydrogenase